MFQSLCTQNVLNESGADGVKCCRKEANRRKVTCVIRSLVSAMSLRLEYARAKDRA